MRYAQFVVCIEHTSRSLRAESIQLYCYPHVRANAPIRQSGLSVVLFHTRIRITSTIAPVYYSPMCAIMEKFLTDCIDIRHGELKTCVRTL